MQIVNNDDTISDKISSSVKKSHKISIYSKRNTRSPKKNQPNLMGRIQDPRDFHAVLTNNQQFYDTNGFSKTGPVLYNNNLGQTNNVNFIEQNRAQTKPNVARQQSYQDKYQSNFFDKDTPVIKKANTLQQNQGPYKKIYQPSKQTYRPNPHNISQMIDKQAESQINNQSIMSGSFMTGNRTIRGKNQESQNSILASNQQDMMQNFMKFMHEQLYIARENYQKKFTQILKENTKAVKQLQQKMFKNQLILKEKCFQVEKMKQTIRKTNSKKVHSEGQIMTRKEASHNVAKVHQGNSNNYYQKRINDLQNRLKVLQSLIEKNQPNSINDYKIQLLQKGIINYSYGKIRQLSTKLQSFLSRQTEKLSIIAQSQQKIQFNLQKVSKQYVKNGFNQKSIKQQQLKVTEIKKELNEFMSKQFKYENYSVYKLQEEMGEFKQQLRKFENFHFDNTKLIKLLSQQANKQFQANKASPITLSNINQTNSKYTLNNPNMSKISISELSNTHEYSHLIQRLNPSLKQHPNKHNNSNSDSLISMSFTEQASESLTPHLNNLQSVKYSQKQQSVTGMSKYTKNTDLKQTCSQLQVSPPSASKYYLPNTKTSISIHSIMAPNDSSTQQKIRNLNDLKMQTVPLLFHNKTPQKPNNKNRPIQIHQQNIDNNNSYLSIGQMEDFNLSRRDVANETSDFSDDQFFYPGYKAKNHEWDSPDRSYKTTQKFLEGEEFSPMKKKLVSTQQNFYQSTKSPESNKLLQSRDKPSFMYNSSFDYEKFSDDQDDKQVRQNTHTQQKKHQNSIPTYKIPPPQYKQKQTQSFTQNEQKLLNSCRGFQRYEYPIKMIYDRKKSQGIIRMLDAGHALNGRPFYLDRNEVQKLEALGYIQIKTYV